MISTRRRLLLALPLALMAGPVRAAAKTRVLPLKKLFPYLDAYYGLPPGERSRFELAYRLVPKGAASGPMSIAFVAAGQRTPVGLAPDGRVLRLPTPAMLKADSSVEVTAPEGSKVAIELEVAPIARPAPQMDAQELALAVRQAADGVRKAAGVLGFAAPKMQVVVFKGAGGGQVIAASGRAAALPLYKGDPGFEPARFPDARTIRFTRAPASMSIGSAK